MIKITDWEDEVVVIGRAIEEIGHSQPTVSQRKHKIVIVTNQSNVLRDIYLGQFKMSRITSFMVGIVASSTASFFIFEEIRDRQCIDTSVQRKHYENKINDVLYKYELSQRINNRYEVSNLFAEKSRNLIRFGGILCNICKRNIVKYYDTFVDLVKQSKP